MVIIGDTADQNSALCIHIIHYNNQMAVNFHRTYNDLASVLEITPLKHTKRVTPCLRHYSSYISCNFSYCILIFPMCSLHTLVIVHQLESTNQYKSIHRNALMQLTLY